MNALKRKRSMGGVLMAAVVAALPATALGQGVVFTVQGQPAQEQQAEAQRRAARDAERQARDAAREAAQAADEAARDADRQAMRQGEQEAQRARGIYRAPAVRVQGDERQAFWFGQQQGDAPAIWRVQPGGEMRLQTYLGISTREITPEVAAQVGELPEGVGLLVAFVEENSPAAKAGIKPHDVLMKFEDQLLINPSQLTVLIRMKKADEKATLTLLRKGEEQEVDVALAQREMPVFRAAVLNGDHLQIAPMAPAIPGQPAAPAALAPLEVEGLMHGLRGLDPERTEQLNRQIEDAMRQLELHVQRGVEGQEGGAPGREAMEAARAQMQELRRQVEQLSRERGLLQRAQRTDLERLGRDARNAARNALSEGGRVIISNEDLRGEMENDNGKVTVRITEDGEEVYSGDFPDEAATAKLSEEAQELVKQLSEYLPGKKDGKSKLEAPTPPAAPTPRRERTQIQV